MLCTPAFLRVFQINLWASGDLDYQFSFLFFFCWTCDGQFGERMPFFIYFFYVFIPGIRHLSPNSTPTLLPAHDIGRLISKQQLIRLNSRRAEGAGYRQSGLLSYSTPPEVIYFSLN